jgi:hypothetical protein
MRTTRSLTGDENPFVDRDVISVASGAVCGESAVLDEAAAPANV